MIKSKGYYCDLPRLLLFYSCETRLRGYEDETGQIGYMSYGRSECKGEK